MSVFTEMPLSLIAVGKAITRNLFKTYVKDSLDSHEARIAAIETVSRIEIFNDEFVGNINDYGAEFLGNLNVYRTFSALSIVESKITLTDANSTTAGTIELDVLKSSDGVTYTSIYSTEPSIGVGINAEGTSSNNFVVDAVSLTIDEGTYLKLAANSIKDTQGNFHFLVYGEPT